jgi:hypothetical protein
MSFTLTYSRLKSATTNPTGLVFTLLAAESPGTPAVFAGAQAGNTTALTAKWQANADENISGPPLVSDHLRLAVAPTLDPVTGITTYTIVATPVLGNGTLGIVQTFTVTHDEPMDQWQTEAGRPRQP